MFQKIKLDDVNMEDDDDDDDDADDDDDDDEVELLPALEVIVRLQAEENVSSHQKEETSQQAGEPDQTEIPELEVSSSPLPEERYGTYIIRQLKPQDRELLRDKAFSS